MSRLFYDSFDLEKAKLQKGNENGIPYSFQDKITDQSIKFDH